MGRLRGELVSIAALLASGCILEVSPRGAEVDLLPDAAPGGQEDGSLSLDEPCLPAAARSPGGDGVVQVNEFRAAWSTPNAVQWLWAASGAAADLGSYSLVVWPEEDCAAASLVGETERPELGGLAERTLSMDLEPDTGYRAQLVAIDLAGLSYASEIVSARTAPPPSRELVIFADEKTAGYSIPSSFVHSTRMPHQGTAHYEYESSCPSGGCFENLRRQALALDLPEMDPDEFDSAFFEFALAAEGAEHSDWSQLRLWWYPGTLDDLFMLSPFTHRADGQYQVYQFPLREFARDGQGLTHAVVQGGLYEFTIGGTWSDGSRISVDEVRIRW